ncbi:MAG: Lrp/AsnC family transcriptional regulator [Haliscomenobacter sp.]
MTIEVTNPDLTGNTPLDELNFQILVQLQKDGRKSFTELAEELGVSVGTIRNRVTRLLEDKVLQISGRVDPVRVGFHAYAQLLICVRPVALIDQVAAQLVELEEVSFLAMTTGMYDLEANLLCRDTPHLSQVLQQIQQVEGVFETKTNMYFKIFKIGQPELGLVRKR